MSDPLPYAVTSCNSCGARIIWARTSTGRSMPVDAEPTDDGNVELLPLVHSQRSPEAIVHPQPPMGAGPLRLSHFASCPHADQWRKR